MHKISPTGLELSMNPRSAADRGREGWKEGERGKRKEKEKEEEEREEKKGKGEIIFEYEPWKYKTRSALNDHLVQLTNYS